MSLLKALQNLDRAQEAFDAATEERQKKLDAYFAQTKTGKASIPWPQPSNREADDLDYARRVAHDELIDLLSTGSKR